MLREAVLTLDSDGTVLGVEVRGEVDSCCGVEFYSGILIPGMVNAHTHLELSYLRGAIPEACGFAGFAAGLSAVRDKFTDEQRQDAMRFQDARMWAEGVSAVGDISNGADSFAVKQRSKIDYHTFIEVYGLRLDSLSAAGELRRRAAAQGLRATVTPHSTYSLNERMFAEAIGGEDNAPLSVHFMESEGEADLYRGEGEMRRWYDRAGFTTDFTTLYGSPAERVIARIPPSRRVLLVHDTCVGDDDARRLADHFGDNLTWVLCPRSNRFITGDEPPVEMLRRAGGRVAVGTDSLASNHSLSMIEELKMFDGVPLAETLRWATDGGARALGLDHLGAFEPGRRPGVVLIEGADLDRMRLTPQATTRRLM